MSWVLRYTWNKHPVDVPLTPKDPYLSLSNYAMCVFAEAAKDLDPGERIELYDPNGKCWDQREAS